MQSDLLLIRRKALAFIGCALFIAAAMGMVFVDVRWMNDGVHETSFTEIAQELMLLVTALLWFFNAYWKQEARSMSLLIGGFFSCMLIRELDFLFDELSHGCWVWFALSAATVCLFLAALHPKRAVAGLADLLRHPGWGMLCAGLLTVLVFARLFGMGFLWQHLMLDGYNHTVKNMAEEGCELLGYSLCLLASCGYLYDRGRQTTA